MEAMSSLNELVYAFFKDKQGRIVLFQFPNLPLIVWFATLLGAKVVSTGNVHDLLNLLSFSALFFWAWLEAFYGVNYFRRALGLIVIIYSIRSHL